MAPIDSFPKIILIALGVLGGLYIMFYGWKFLDQHREGVLHETSKPRPGLGWYYARRQKREQEAIPVREEEEVLPQYLYEPPPPYVSSSERLEGRAG